jgi:hypothetical protein
MDKIITKNILENSGIKQLPYFGMTAFDWTTQPHILREKADFL